MIITFEKWLVLTQWSWRANFVFHDTLVGSLAVNVPQNLCLFLVDTVRT